MLVFSRGLLIGLLVLLVFCLLVRLISWIRWGSLLSVYFCVVVKVGWISSGKSVLVFVKDKGLFNLGV